MPHPVLVHRLRLSELDAFLRANRAAAVRVVLPGEPAAPPDLEDAPPELSEAALGVLLLEADDDRFALADRLEALSLRGGEGRPRSGTLYFVLGVAVGFRAPREPEGGLGLFGVGRRVRLPPSSVRRAGSSDPWDILGVSRTASERELKAAYRREMRAHHPDRAKPEGREDAERRTRRIREAWDAIRALREAS